MEKEQPVEKVYRLIETYDFNELPESEKAYVLEIITLEEYNNMRATIADARELFSKFPVGEAGEQPGMLRKLITFPVELYKIAAVFLLLAGIGFVFLKTGTLKQSRQIASVDTVYVEKTNTVYLETRDTIRIIMERAVYKDQDIRRNQPSYNARITETMNYGQDCSVEICPSDMGKLSALKTKSDFSRDTALKGFITAIY
jgi:hypothetical protein